ncbi:MAG: SAM-dependent methyltransferase [Bryobacterales bacterium]|nr:SAM-dependent methyltransferase [Bryobacterales bacterium]
MTRAGAILLEEIMRRGPITFRRFMDVALYHPECGYYRQARDVFGRGGDYYTAEQIQPVFGILIAARIRRLHEEAGRPADFTVVELGAGRGEMAEAFSGFRYVPLEIGAGEWPARFTGVVFSNEFFDALPVDVAARRGGVFLQMLVGWREGRFAWVEGPPVPDEQAEYLARFGAAVEEGAWVEINLDALRWLDEISAHLERGWVFTIDYGYTARELAGFPRGTLMSYRRHAAGEDVLADPGERDITAHVCFTALQDRGASLGLETVRFENLSRTLLDAGEPDGFAEALAAASPHEALRRRLQLKTLLAGMGEIFRTLIQRRA